MSLIVIGTVACGNDGAIQAPMPGSITVATETSGFLKDDSYELLVDGEVKATIGANDEVTVAELDPATYEVGLGDVADNCAVDGSIATVESEATASVSLSVVCAPAAADVYTLRYNRARPNLDNTAITECPFGICSTEEEWDLYVYYSSASTPHSIIRQNQAIDVEIAHLPGVTLATLTEEDVAGATFTTELVGDAFDSGRVILIRTDLGSVYALGNPVEDDAAQTLTFDAVFLVASE